MQNIIYVAHTSERDLKRARFSILNLLYFRSEIEQKHRIVVYTDNPLYFSDLDVLVEEMDNVTISMWQGASGSDERVRVMAARDAFATYHGNMIMVQNEAFYLDSPEPLFWELSNNSSIMYEEVGPFNSLGLQLPDIINYLTVEPYKLATQKTLPAPPPGTLVFDMGVIAMHDSDRALIKKVLCYFDALLVHLPEKMAASLAFSYVLGNNTLLQEGNDWLDVYTKNNRGIDGLLMAYYKENYGLPIQAQPTEAWRLAHQFDGSLKYAATNIMDMVKEIIR
jgi:hypothetical protein